MAVYERDVEQAIRIILGTDWGERVMRPDFGAGLNSFVFGPLNQTTLRSVQSRVQESLIKWEPRIDVEQVKVSLDPSEPGKLVVAVTYRIRVTNSVNNLVYDFYLKEGAAR
jgi:phage baseplate assembly protein W